MATAAEKTIDTSTKQAAAKKDSLGTESISEQVGGSWAQAPPMPPPVATGKSVQLKTNTSVQSFGKAIVQREAMPEEEELQMKADGPAQLMEDEELLQGKFESKSELPNFGKTVAQAKSNNTGMPADVQAKMENSFGADFSDVKVHANSTKASDIGAQAYAQGSDIHMAPGKFNPSSQSGQELLGHELTHVVQQREGRVQATTQAKGIPVNDDNGLEKEADNFGAIAARGGIVQQKTASGSPGKASFAAQLKVVQMNDGPQEQAPINEDGLENEMDENEEGEQDVPIPGFPAFSPEEAQEAEVENQEAEAEESNEAPPLPPRPGSNAGPKVPAPAVPRRIQPHGNQETSRHSEAARTNYNADNRQDYSEYGITGSGVTAAAASATTKGLQYGDTIGQGANIKDVVTGGAKISKFGETASAISGLGVAAGGLGVIGAGADALRAKQTIKDKDKTAGDRLVGGGGALLSAAAGGVKESAATAYHASNLAGNAATAAGAVTAAGVGSVVMGAADIARGGYGAYQADKRGDKLKGQEEWTQNADVRSAAHQAATTQDMRKAHAKGTIVKGLLLVAGGTTLILLGSNPVGWGLLAGAAIVGGIASLSRFLAKRGRKKDVAIRELGVTAEYEAFQAKMKTASRKEKNQLKQTDPLAKAMVSRGYKADAYGKFYADYIHDTAWVLYNCGVLGDQSYPMNQEMRTLITNMGLKVVDKTSPLPDKIASNLHK